MAVSENQAPNEGSNSVGNGGEGCFGYAWTEAYFGFDKLNFLYI